MEIYFIGFDKYFSTSQQDKLKTFGKVYYLDSLQKIENAPFYKSKDNKIIAISPSFCNYTFTNSMIDRISNLKSICLYTTTYHYIDVDYCHKKGIIVTNIKNYAQEAIAEYMIFLMMCVLRKLPLQIKYGKQEFSDFFLQSQVSGKVVGIIGLGNIGTKIAQICTSLGMKVFYWTYKDLNPKYDYMPLKDIFKNCDIIFSMLVINELSKTFITDEMLTSMKKDAVFVSGTSTYIHNHELVLEMVRKNKIYGYALEEPNKHINDYMGNVMVTCEYGWFTKEAKQKRVSMWIDCIESIIKNKPINKV